MSSKKKSKAPKPSTRAELPLMPKDAPVLTLGAGIRAELLSDFARYSSGNMILSITEAELSHDGKKVGRVRAEARGMGVQVTIFPDGDESKGRSWFIKADQLFAAVLAADQEREKTL